MKTYNLIFATAIVIINCQLSITNGYAQDTRFSQSYLNPLKLNPAIMGSNHDIKLLLDNRTQWGSIDKGFRSFNAAVVYPLYIASEKEKLDLGLNFLSDRAGAFSTTDVSLSFGYGLKIADNSHLSFALQGGYVQKSLSVQNLSFDEQYILGTYSAGNPNGESELSEKKGYADVGYGMMWYYNPSKASGAKMNAFIGMSGFHLNTPNESLIKNKAGNLPAKLAFQGGIKIFGKDKVDFIPNIRVTTQKGSEEVAAGLCTDYSFAENFKVTLGVWYRSHDAFAVALGMDSRYFSIGYSYDIVTDLNRYVAAANAHEITLSLKLNRGSKANHPQFGNDGVTKSADDSGSPFPMF